MFDLWSFLHQTAAASMTALFVLVLQHIFRDKLSPQWQYAVWMVVVLRLILPVGWLGRSAIADLTGLGEALRTWVELGLDSAWSSPWTPSLPLAGIPIPPAGGLPRSVTDWLFLLYLAGVLLSALWLAAGGLRLRRSLGEAVPVAGARLEAVAALAERFGLSMPRRVVESRAASTPFLVGVVRPVLVLPMGWAPDRKVILHELIHLKQRDVAAGWVTALFRCVHWCNPFLWRIFDRIDNQREQRCDQLVLERLEGEDRRDYGRVLLSMADDGRRRFPGATTMANGGQNIKARIQAITRFKAFPRGMGLVSVCMVVTLTLSLVVGLPVSAADPLPGAVRLLGPVGSLSYALSHRPATVGGALDAYSKGIYAQYHDVQDCYAYQAMTLPQEQLPDLVEEWRQTDRAGACSRGPIPDRRPTAPAPSSGDSPMMGRGVTGPRCTSSGTRAGRGRALSAPSATAATPSTSSAGRTAPGRSRPCRYKPAGWPPPLSGNRYGSLLTTTFPSPARSPPFSPGTERRMGWNWSYGPRQSSGSKTPI